MDDSLAPALIAAARAFADELERRRVSGTAGGTSILRPGTEGSMFSVLRSMAEINDDQRRGVSDDEIREIARRAGMDPRGMAGYYAAGLLEKRGDGKRWLSAPGRDRLAALSQTHVYDPTPSSQPVPPVPQSEDNSSSEVRQRILQASRRLLVAGGLQALTISAIETEADVYSSAIHYHFGSKEDLLLQVIRRRADPINQVRLATLERFEARSPVAQSNWA